MRTGTLLAAILIFCAVPGAGYWAFRTPAASSQPAHALLQNRLHASLYPASFDASQSAGLNLLQSTSQRVIDRTFKAVKHGTQNDNIHMTHFVSSEYREGTVHKVPAQRGASVRWTPHAQELWRGNQLASVLSNAQPAKGQRQTDGLDQIVFPATYPETHERFYVRADGGVEHDIVIRQAPAKLERSTDLAYSGFLQMSSGLTLWDGSHQITESYSTSHAVQIKNAAGNTVMVLHRPVAFDASVTAADGSLDAAKQSRPEHQPARTDCQYHFSFEDAGIRLAAAIPGEWMASSKRAYPVTLDPVFGPYGLQDGDPPSYVGTVYTSALIPAWGTTKIQFNTCPGAPDDGVSSAPIQIPFPFVYYERTVTALNVHIDGWADITDARLCGPHPNRPIPDAGSPHFAVYWDDLKFNSDPNSKSGVYYFMDGVAPDRRLVIEWHAMLYKESGNATETISFNLVLHECENKIEYILGTYGDTDRNAATVGMQDPDRTRGIQYTYEGRSAAPPQLPLNPGTAIMFRPATLPLITSATQFSGTASLPFSYTITATNTPTSFNATGLPRGLSVDTATGVISGTPTATGVFNVILHAYNISGPGKAYLTLTIDKAPVLPVITSAGNATGLAGSPFSFFVTARNNPASFNAQGLPDGLSINTGSGQISGTLRTTGVFPVSVSASNAAGTATAALTISSYCGLSVACFGNGRGTVTLDPPGGQYAEGTVVTLSASCAEGSTFSGWSGAASGAEPAAAVIMTGSKSVSATFAAVLQQISTSAATGGTVSPGGVVAAVWGSDQTFAITPASEYSTVDVVADGVSVGIVEKYTFVRVTADHTLSAVFRPNHVPVIGSVLPENPATARVGEVVAFAAAATDADADPITYAWTFGDGTAASGASVSHVFGTPGFYNATVSVSDGLTHAEKAILLLVQSADGTQNPSGPADESASVTIAKLQGAVVFNRSGCDTLQLSAVLTGGAAAAQSGSTVTVNAAGVEVSFVLDGKRRSVAGRNSLVFKRPARSSSASGLLTIKLGGGSWAETWVNAGMCSDATASMMLELPVNIVMEGAVFSSRVPVTYSVKKGIRGKFRK